MITMWEMYWLIKLDAICAIFGVLTGIFGAISLVLILMSIIDTMESWGCKEKDDFVWDVVKKYVFVCIPFCTLFGLLAALTPTTKEMAVIIVTPKIVNAVVNNEELKKLPNNVVGLANLWIEKLKPVEFDGKKYMENIKPLSAEDSNYLEIH